MNKEEALAKLCQYSTCNYKEQIWAPEAKELLEYWSGVEKQIKQLQQENKELKEKINTYEDPEDLTLMFMYCNEKAKDKIKELHNKIDEISVFIKENKIKRYRPIEGEEYDEEIVLDEDDITCLERIINDEYDYENR